MAILPNARPEEVELLINQEYAKLPKEQRLGWSYIYSRIETRESPQLVTIGLNPGGGRDDRDWKAGKDLFFSGEGSDWNAYFHQPWVNEVDFTPLQKQIQLLKTEFFHDVAFDEILSFQFIPFRSPSWNALGDRDQAARLGGCLLDWTLANLCPSTTVIAFGVGAVRSRLEQWFEVLECKDVPVGWGRLTASVCSSPKCKKLIFLPHLSRYQIIGRPEFVRANEVFE